jgi:hypothetical protein
MKSMSTRWAGHVALMGGMRNAYRILVGNTEETTSETMSRRYDNSKMNLKEI